MGVAGGRHRETDKEYLIKAELPEVKKEDVRIMLEDGVITISGERRIEKEHKEENESAWRASTARSRAASRCRKISTPRILAESKDGVLRRCVSRRRRRPPPNRYPSRSSKSTRSRRVDAPACSRHGVREPAWAANPTAGLFGSAANALPAVDSDADVPYAGASIVETSA